MVNLTGGIKYTRGPISIDTSLFVSMSEEYEFTLEVRKGNRKSSTTITLKLISTTPPIMSVM